MDIFLLMNIKKDILAKIKNENVIQSLTKKAVNYKIYLLKSDL